MCHVPCHRSPSFHELDRDGRHAGLAGEFRLSRQAESRVGSGGRPAAEKVQLSAEIEPYVRLIEETPREHLLAAIARKIRSGTSYQQVFAALMLAGVRCIKPRPVGFKFHAVLVVHSAHLASLAAPDTDRWLPLFWALDNFKSAQASGVIENHRWVMPPVNESRLPPSTRAQRRFMEAMDNWDEEGVDSADRKQREVVNWFARHAGSGMKIGLCSWGPKTWSLAE